MSSPKPLHEVLEEEYVSMYGPLEPPADGDNSEQARLANVYSAIHKRAADKKDPHPRTALCISGGGIRSATFALGVIQGLASANVLKKFDYLSTVSGGGYIGSWLSSWIRRHPDGVAGVQCDLQQTDTAITGRRPYADSAKKNMVLRDEDKKVTPREIPADKLDPEPAPVRHLREYSNYLSPKLGLLSGDSWTMASLYIRNLLLNLLVLVPLLALALAVPRVFSWGLDQRHRMPDLSWPWIAAGLTMLGFAYIGWTRPVEQSRGGKKGLFQTSDGWFMLLCVVPLTLASAALAIFWARVQEAPAALKSPDARNAAILAVIGMTVVPFVLYYTRYILARRSTFRAEFWRQLFWKVVAEFGAVAAAVATTAALLYLLAEKVFYEPLRTTPDLARKLPIERFDFVSSPQAQLFVCFAVPVILLVFFAQASIFVGLSGRKNEDYDREWWGRAGAWLLFFSVAIGLVSFIAVFGPVALYNAPVILASIGGGAGVAAAVLGFSDKTPANQKQKEKGGSVAAAGNFASMLIVPLFVVFLLAAISLGSTWLTQEFRDLPKGVTEAQVEAQKRPTRGTPPCRPNSPAPCPTSKPEERLMSRRTNCRPCR
ncbi:MAG TPA: patatin-like phospholipase family protein [Thermoanaerobaculia bacterium]|nr:patatin-like phospholipase family protein [Thermoanaerobaculia bacterium]